MKQLNITIHPFSALAGMALLGLVLVVAAASFPIGSQTDRDISATTIVDRPSSDWVRIDSSTPFTVPTSRYFHLTGLGMPANSNSAGTLLIDGMQTIVGYGNVGTGNGCSVKTTPEGIVASSGSIVTVPLGFAFGYLADN